MRRWGVSAIAAIGVLCAEPGWAAPSARQLELAQRYLETLGPSPTPEAVLKSMEDIMGPTFSKNEDTKLFLREVLEVMSEEAKKNAAEDRQDAVNAYAEAFSEEELEGMITFNESNVGRAVREKQPAVSAKLAAKFGERSRRLTAEVIRRLMLKMCDNGKCSTTPSAVEPRPS